MVKKLLLIFTFCITNMICFSQKIEWYFDCIRDSKGKLFLVINGKAEGGAFVISERNDTTLTPSLFIVFYNDAIEKNAFILKKGVRFYSKPINEIFVKDNIESVKGDIEIWQEVKLKRKVAFLEGYFTFLMQEERRLYSPEDIGFKVKIPK